MYYVKLIISNDLFNEYLLNRACKIINLVIIITVTVFYPNNNCNQTNYSTAHKPGYANQMKALVAAPCATSLHVAFS